MRIILLELSMSGPFHTGVNSGFVRMLHKLYPDARLVFRAEKKHLESCRRKLAEIPVNFSPLPFFPEVSLRTLLLRDLLGCLYAAHALIKSRKNDTLFFLNLLPVTHWIVFLLNRLRRRSVYICLHGQLEAYVEGNSLRGTRLYFNLDRPLFRWDRRNRYILLGQPVFDRIGHIFSKNTQTIIIDHPYPYDPMENSPIPYQLPLRLGQVGTGNNGKGSQQLFFLAERLRDYIETGKIEITLAGCMDKALRSLDNGLVRWYDKPLNETEFSKESERLHYHLILRDKTTGQAVASGSFFDSVKAGKPFLSLDNDFVRYYAQHFPGTGTLYPTLDAMAEAIKSLADHIENGATEYLRKTEMLKTMREALSPEAIAENFKTQL